MRTTLQKVMNRAWEIKREDKRNIFAECLKMAWKEIKNTVKRMEKTMKELLLSKGLKVWQKKDESGNVTVERIYINDLTVIGLEKVTENVRGFKKVSIYFDVLKNEFFYNGLYGSSTKKVVDEVIENLKKELA